MSVRMLSSLLAAVVLCLLTVSCQTTKQKTPISANVSNEQMNFWGTYSVEFNTAMHLLDKAVRNTCARARLTKISKTFRETSCEYKYADVDRIPLEIELTEIEMGAIRLSIKIGSWGDFENSQRLAVAIDEELRLMTTGGTK